MHKYYRKKKITPSEYRIMVTKFAGFNKQDVVIVVEVLGKNKHHDRMLLVKNEETGHEAVVLAKYTRSYVK